MVNPPISVHPDSVKFGLTSLESEKFVVSVENGAEGQQVVMIDLSAGNTVTKQKMKAEAAIMNPVSKVIALRG